MEQNTEKEFPPFAGKIRGSSQLEDRVKLCKTLFANALSLADFQSKGGILISGDPGIGKTSFMKQFAKVSGLPMVVIEAPQITEEHVIQIPFLILTKDGREQGIEHVHGEIDAEFDVELADSHLYSTLTSMQKEDDQTLIRKIQSEGGDTKMLWERLGGNASTIPSRVAKFRNEFRVILFLDEYYRTVTPRIRNILRTILDGHIGDHHLPQDVFTVYASNMTDRAASSIEPMGENHQFAGQVKMDTPARDSWFAYLHSICQKRNIPWHDNLMEKMHKLMSHNLEAAFTKNENGDWVDAQGKVYPSHDADGKELPPPSQHSEHNNHLSYQDFDADVRTSPRRWEQILLVLNTSLPVKTKEEAQSVINFVNSQFKHYQTGDKSNIARFVADVVAKLIEEESDITVSPNFEFDPDSEWEKAFEFQIEAKKKLGDLRTYVPMLAGLPGVGKTTTMHRVAMRENLILISVNVQNLSRESVLGLPLKGKTDENGKFAVKFSAAALHKKILADIKDQEQKQFALWRSQPNGSEKIEKFKNQKFKYLLFFDELNRNNNDVFNAIRRLLLEKEFDAKHRLPEGVIMTAAINPKGKGVTPFTSHVVDVLDTIPTGADFSVTMSKLKAMPLKRVENEVVPGIVQGVLENFNQAFSLPRDTDEIQGKIRKFFIDVGGYPVYVSPRDYQTFYTNACHRLDDELTELIEEKPFNLRNADEIQDAEHKLRETIFEVLRDGLNQCFTRAQMDRMNNKAASDFMAHFAEWVMKPENLEFGEGLFFRRQSTANIGDILEAHIHDPDADALAHDPAMETWLQTVGPDEVFDGVYNFFLELFERDYETFEEMVGKLKHPLKHIDMDTKELVGRQKRTAVEKVDPNDPTKKTVEYKTEDAEVKVSTYVRLAIELAHAGVAFNLGPEYFRSVGRAVNSAFITVTKNGIGSRPAGKWNNTPIGIRGGNMVEVNGKFKQINHNSAEQSTRTPPFDSVELDTPEYNELVKKLLPYTHKNYWGASDTKGVNATFAKYLSEVNSNLKAYLDNIAAHLSHDPSDATHKRTKSELQDARYVTQQLPDSH